MVQFTNDDLFNCCPRSSEPSWGEFTSLQLFGCKSITPQDGALDVHAMALREFLNDGKYVMQGLGRDGAEFFTVYGIREGSHAQAITSINELARATTVLNELARRSGLSAHVLC
ncbi:hypothetical protein QYR01_24270 [Brucella anthropi]|uniref:hypothetical protein n=1 Tax=Brucella anthropi TaxID=529 RepID=UPI00267256B8|nr:hypothetical protein [Brucella anthropi]WKT94519.1 hypothetical protein QYR01_24270 [Brucella anthropi]